MKTLLTLLLLTISLYRICHGQNLVPNGNFEQHSSCPTNTNQLYKATYWINPTVWTPDYYHKCAGGTVGVPNNAGGFQNALSDSAYAGIFLYSASPGREYIETPLTTSLVAGSSYFFEMYINLLDNSKYSARNIGVYFSDTLVYQPTNYFTIPVTPQIINTNPLYPDTTNWYQVSGIYVAHGGENFIVIGNFDNDANTSLQIVNPSGYDYAVVYIDNVNLTTTVGINELNKQNVSIFSNPFHSTATFELKQDFENAELRIYNTFGEEVRRQRIISQTTTFNRGGLGDGLYFYQLTNDNGIVKSGRLMIE